MLAGTRITTNDFACEMSQTVASSTKLGEVGRRLTHSAVDQIEKGTRRVDVDDLMALAAALDVSPATLLMPVGEEDQEIAITVTWVS